MESLFQEARNQKVFTDLDWHIGQLLTQRTPLVGISRARFLFLIIYLSAQRRAGHVCIFLSQLDESGPWMRSEVSLMRAFWLALDKPAYSDWLDVLHASTIVEDADSGPVILVQDRLYFQRLWHNEQTVARFFQMAADRVIPAPKALHSILQSLFDSQEILERNWQKIAVAMALTRSVTIISGGPGTGKTTTVAKILAAYLLSVSSKGTVPRIKAAAPTGKAAARLTTSLKMAVATLPDREANTSFLPMEAVTLHRLLGAGSQRQAFLYNKNNRLHLDILIIDEASMVDLSMMASVIDALPEQAKLILLGDREQLSSVEAGAVLGDLCRFSTGVYSESRAQEIEALTGDTIPSDKNTPPIADTICLLQKSYRFDEHSGIGLLANDIKQGKSSSAIHRLNSQRYDDIAFHEIAENGYEALLQNVVEKYKAYLHVLRDTHDVKHALEVWDQFRLLAAVREGKYGVEGLNGAIECALIKQREITMTSGNTSYLGRPVMILKNHPKLALWNGDIGITWYSEADPKKKRVYFHLADGTLRGFSPALLPEHETAFVMTVHKAQGSEFSHAALVLPDEYTPLLTRSLLYTAVTRAKQKITLYGSTAILSQTIQSQIERHSGLHHSLVVRDKLTV